jgi:dipeptidyl-peptidase-4
VSKAQTQESGVLTLDRVFASPSLSGPTPRGVKLSPDGHWLTMLRPRTDERERYDLWGFDRKSGQWKMLIDSKTLSSGAALSEAEKMQRERLRVGDLKGIISYSWAADSKAVLVPLDGALYLASLDGHVQKLETGADPLNPALSTSGKYVSFVRDRRFWVVPVAGGQAQAITPAEASETVHWGEAEFVAQEEMARFKGAWWSPGDKLVAIERFDEAHVGVVTRTSIGATGTKTFDQRYPAAGTPNAEVSIWIVKADGSGKVEVDLGRRRTLCHPRRLGARWQGALCAAPEPRPDEAGCAEGRSGHRPDHCAVYRNGASEDVAERHRRLPLPQGRHADLAVRAGWFRPSLSLRSQGRDVDPTDQGPVGGHLARWRG